MADFSEALKWLKNGEKVRRKCWDKDCFIRLEQRGSLGKRFVTEIGTHFSATASDCTAEDWEFRDDKRYYLTAPSSYYESDIFFVKMEKDPVTGHVGWVISDFYECNPCLKTKNEWLKLANELGLIIAPGKFELKEWTNEDTKRLISCRTLVGNHV
jgi:hypothetical protein